MIHFIMDFTGCSFTMTDVLTHAVYMHNATVALSFSAS